MLERADDNGVKECWLGDPCKRTTSVNILHDGRCVEATHTGGSVEFATLPGLRIEIGTLFDMPDWILTGNDDKDEDGE